MLKDLKEELETKREEAAKLNKEIIQIRRKILEEGTGFKAGDIFENKKGERGILVHNDQWGSAWYWRKFKQDGNPSKAINYCYDVPVINR